MAKIIITSKGLMHYAKKAYKQHFNAHRVPKDGILLVDKGLYVYQSNVRYSDSTIVDFDPPYEDIVAVTRANKLYKKLAHIIQEEETYFYGDLDFNYSSMILWEIHHAFKVPLSRMATVHKLPHFNKETRTILFADVYVPHGIETFLPEHIRKMIGLSVLKLSLYRYFRENIYGQPINLSTFLYIKLRYDKRLSYRDAKMNMNAYIESFDISSPQMRLSGNVTYTVVEERLCEHMRQDIQGYLQPDFLEQLQDQLDDFALGALQYPEYKKHIENLFNIEGDLV